MDNNGPKKMDSNDLKNKQIIWTNRKEMIWKMDNNQVGKNGQEMIWKQIISWKKVDKKWFGNKSFLGKNGQEMIWKQIISWKKWTTKDLEKMDMKWFETKLKIY